MKNTKEIKIARWPNNKIRYVSAKNKNLHLIEIFDEDELSLGIYFNIK